MGCHHRWKAAASAVEPAVDFARMHRVRGSKGGILQYCTWLDSTYMGYWSRPETAAEAGIVVSYCRQVACAASELPSD